MSHISHQQTVLLPFLGAKILSRLGDVNQFIHSLQRLLNLSHLFPAACHGWKPGEPTQALRTAQDPQRFLGKPPVNGDYMVPLIGGIGTI